MTQADIILWIRLTKDIGEFYDNSADTVQDDYETAAHDAQKGNARAKMYINEFVLRKLRS